MVLSAMLEEKEQQTSPWMLLYELASQLQEAITDWEQEENMQGGVKQFGLELMVLCSVGLPYDAEELPARRQHQARGSPHSTPRLLGSKGCVWTALLAYPYWQ
jgi:hypothetical protein